MSVGTLDAVINSVYLALSPTGGPESQIPPNTPIWLVVKAEAGSTLVSLNASFNIKALLQDITSFTNVLNNNVSGNLGNPPWTTANTDTAFTFPITSGVVGTVYRPFAILRIGGGSPTFKFIEGDLVIVD